MKNITPHKFFLISSMLFGLLFSFITPPFQVPDEINHFYRAYQISEGNFSAVKNDNRLGGYIPESIIEFSSQYRKLSSNKYSKINYKEIIMSKDIFLNASEKKFIDFPNTSLYTPVSYIPQSITFFIMRLLDSKPFYMLYAARIVTLLFWIFIVYFAIKIIPFQKWLFVILAMLPMSISINSSISADILTNALSFLLIAYFLRIAGNNKGFSIKDLIYILLLVIFLGLAKMLYVLLALVFLILPKRKFKSLKHYIFSFTVILFFGVAFAFVGKKGIDKLYTPYEMYNPDYREYVTLGDNADMNKQIKFIKKNKKKTVFVFTKSFIAEFNSMINSYIGKLGWGDTQLPKTIILLSYIIIFLIAIGSNIETFGFNFRQRLVLLFTVIILVLFIMLSQYLTWNPVGSDKVYPLQGRYFIPVFPLIFIIFSYKKIRVNDAFLKSIVIVFILFVGIYSSIFLFNRFYYNYNLTKHYEVKCNVELFNANEELFHTEGNDTIRFQNNNLKTDKEHHSGDYSIKLSAVNQFGFVYKFYDVKKGDKLIVSVWRKGDNGSIVFQEDKKNGEYLISSKRKYSGKDGWHLFESVFFAPKDMLDTGLKIYLWNNSADVTYFDDYKISFFKKL